MSACTDLDVVNQNQPDRSRAITTPGDVESLISGGFLSWHRGNYEWAPGPAFSTMADEHTASWGNFGMKDLSSEPRTAFNNDPSYSYAYVAQNPWTFMYRTLSGARDGLIAINDGLEIGQNGQDTPRARAFARFLQGIAHGTLAQVYDQAFILDENTDLEAADFSPYNEVLAVALSQLEEAVSIANSNTFTLPAEWMGGVSVSNVELAQIAHSMIARYMATVPRTVAERDAVNWNTVISHVDQGITEDKFVIGEGTCSTCWRDATKAWGGVYSSWARADVRYIGPADQSGAFQAWIATPVANRNAILIDTDDLRMTQPGDPESDGLYTSFEGRNSSAFRPERGLYHLSDYRDRRHDDYAANLTGPAIWLNYAEMELTKAEGLLRTGNTSGALEIINRYRANGGLPPATASGVSGARCVPRTEAGACGDLFEALKYEKRVEVWHHAMGTAFFDDRGWGDLVSGTPIHLPVPGNELLILLKDIYTFGGGGEGSAPAPGLEVDLTLDDLSPEEIHRRREALELFDRDFAAEFDGIMN
ncbi:MAG: RagB/SusD family nutrient uptake outer membrane protein [Planctomycetota bacterium]|nr:MAG: RagB/SusD family nutrient uptake outer membrane protein [Planctomycetota bacterium]